MRQPEESINGPIFRFCVVPSGYSFGKRAPLISKKKRQRRTAASGKSGCFTIPQNYSYNFIHPASLYKMDLQSVRIASGRLSTRTPLFPAPPSDKKRHFRSTLPSDFPGNTNCRRRSRTRSSRQQQLTAPKPFPVPAVRGCYLTRLIVILISSQTGKVDPASYKNGSCYFTLPKETVVKELYIICSIPVPLLLNQICFQCCGNTQH